MSNGRILFIAGGCIMLSIAFFLKKKKEKKNNKKKERKKRDDRTTAATADGERNKTRAIQSSHWKEEAKGNKMK